MERLQRFSIRKLSIGAVSCVIGTVAFFSYSTEVKAAENTDPSLKIVETNKANNPATSDVTVDNTNKQAVVNTSDQSKSDDSSAVASTSERNQLQTSQDSSIKVKENNLNTDKSDTPKAVVQPTSLNDENKLRDPDSKDVEVKPKESSNVDTNEQKETSTVLSKQPANADTQLAATMSGVQPFMNLAVVSDNNDLTPKRETVDSTWTLHYVNQADHKQELKDPTVMTMQYERTNTPQSDGKIQYGDWSYVPGSFKQTGTPITVKDSDNPVKQDNVDKNGENFDVFTITAMYPTVAGYNFYNGINGTRLHDNLRNNERQADAMSKDFYAEYDVAKERSVNVKFVDDQSFDPNVSGGKAQVGQAITLTGRDGDTVKVNVTVPDKYQLANGQQLPTTYTFAKGSGDLTIHLVHKVVQREATVNVKLVMMTGVDIEGVDGTRETITQERREQLGNKFNVDSEAALVKILPSVEVGTLTGHVNYDVVDNKVVSFGDDWTTLNLGGHTYQLPNGVDVVNGVLIDFDDGSLDKLLREYYLSHYSIVNPGHSVDPDYATRPWYGYLSVNETNDPNSPASEWNDLGLQGGLAGNEPNALAKANGDRAATAVEMTNKTIDVSVLGTGLFNEQDGRLQATLPVPVAGVYIPYVEKTATRTINITNPDGKTIAVKQTATLAKQIDFNKDAHPSWTTSEWTSYDVPVIPGYTASQSNVAKEAVTGATNDQTVNITYIANPQTTTVVYQTEDGTPVHTTTVNGKTGQTVKVSNEVPVGWKIINGKVPSEITFGSNEIPQTIVTIAHQHVTINPDQPQTNGTKLPDNPAKTFSGVEANDLNKTITRTIKVTTPDGQTKTVAQTAKLTRNADVDEVTGEVTYGKWTTGKWDAYEVSTVPGYTASQNEVPATEVTSDTTDQTIDISYTANSQTIHINYVDDNNAGKIVHTAAVTGKTGETVSLNLTVPDKYQLADGQQLPTIYTFTAGSGDVTIHLAHKVVQREAAVDVQIGFMTLVDLDDEDDPAIVVTQNQWRQLDDEIKKHALVNDLEKVDPTVGVGTLTGHVNYDLVDNKAVSFGNDWTTLNLGGKTYQMPDGTEVVNGIIVGTELSWGKKLKEHILKYVPDIDPDYVTRPWHGYLSVNKSYMGSDFLVGNEPNALAKSTGDRAATAIEMPNQPIDLSSLQDSGMFGYLSDFNEQDGQLRAKAIVTVDGMMYIPYVEKTATRTINVTTPDGKTTTVKQTTTLAKKITFNKDAHPDWTTGEWTDYDVPVISGYTASQSNVAKEAVTGVTKDQTVNITYTANPQTTTVVYQTEDGTPVHTTTVNGHTGQTVKVSNEVPVGWHIVNGTVPSEITFGSNGTPKTVVTIAHSHATVTSDASKTTSDKLPDNPSKAYPVGVGENDLNKTVTRTIKVTTPDGQTKTVAQTAKLTRTADVDEVTGEVKYSDWTTDNWSAYTAPSVPGYTASQSSVTQQAVTDTTRDQTVNITYTANDGTQTIVYQDEDGSEVGKQVISGKTDEKVKVTPDVPDGYVLKGEVPSEVTIKPNDTPITVTVEHGKSHVTPDKPVNKGDLIPDTKDKHYPEGLTHNDLNKTVTREITITDPTGKKTTTTQTVTFTRGATVDEVTNEVTYDDWSENGKHTFDKVDVPNVPGYTASSDVPSVVVTPENKSTTVKITYTANDGSQTIVYEDKNDGEAGKQVVPGKTDQTVKVTPEIPDGYVVTGEVPSEVTIKPKDTPIVVHVEHGKSHVTPDKPVNKGDLIPGTKDKHYPDGLTHDDLNKTVTRDVEITTPDGRKTSTHQEVTFTRGATVDEVTGKVTYGTWSEGGKHTFEKADVPTVPGYTASGNVPSVVVTPESKSSIVKITYTENGQKASENSSNTDVTDQNDANVDENNNGHQISNDPTDDKSNDSNKDREKVKKTRKSGQLGLNNNSNSRLSKENKGFTKPDKDNFEQAKQEKQLPQAGESKDSLSIMGLGATALFGVFSFGLKKKKKE